VSTNGASFSGTLLAVRLPVSVFATEKGESLIALRNTRRTRLGNPPSANCNVLAATVRRLVSNLQVSTGEKHGNEVILETEVDGSLYQLVRKSKPQEPAIGLSPREYEILRLVAAGHPNKIIADILQISSFTVSTYLRRSFAKLGVSSRAAMVARFHELGLVKLYESGRLPDDAAACQRSDAIPDRAKAPSANTVTSRLRVRSR
jgi:DNA-binding CsgD family transcriptional regulator